MRIVLDTNILVSSLISLKEARGIPIISARQACDMLAEEQGRKRPGLK